MTADLASALRGFGPLALLGFMAIMLTGHYLGAALALVWCALSKTRWEKIGLRRPARPVRTLLVGVGLGVALKLAMKALVLPALGFPPTNPAYAYLAGNARALPGMLFTVIVAAGIGEEIQWRGFLFERLGTWLRVSRAASPLVLLVSSMLFGLSHLRDQGVPGAVQAVMTGLSFGALYLLSGDLALPMVTHAAFDVTAVILIYKGWDVVVARAIFH